ncbi:MAG: hypothetical protein PHD25_11740 [Bacteroidales bacterium]|nr:hypothetical protein [Bacteroidales bacterium]
METIILQGGSKSKSRLLIELARQLDFKVSRLTADELEELGLAISIKEGLKSGVLLEEEKKEFLDKLMQK